MPDNPNDPRALARMVPRHPGESGTKTGKVHDRREWQARVDAQRAAEAAPTPVGSGGLDPNGTRLPDDRERGEGALTDAGQLQSHRRLEGTRAHVPPPDGATVV